MGGINPSTVFGHVDKQATNGCWEWTGHTHKGYGRSHGTQAHRVVYEIVVGPIPDGLEIDHLCRNTLCVNPDHLEPVTRQENIRRRTALKTHCRNGHEFSRENTYALAGRRTCRACNRAAVARYTARRARARMAEVTS